MAPIPPTLIGRVAGRAGLLAIVTAGCAIAPPAVDPGADIRDALGLEQAVRFHAEAGLLDEPLEGGHLGEALAVQRAVETSPELQAALARVRVAERDADLAGRLPNPVLSLVLRRPSGGGSTQVEASLTADLLALLQRPQRAQAAGLRLQSEAAAALSAALDVVADVQTRYAECQVLEALVPVLEQRLAVLDRLVEVARARLELGAGSQHDVLTAEAQRTELLVEVDRRRHDRRQARLALARRIGAPSAAADWSLDAWTAPATAPTSESDCLESALATRPELVALEWEVRAREDEEALSSGLPWDGAAAGVDAEEDEDGDWSVGPSVTTPLPLFDSPAGRRERAQAHTAEARHRLAEARRAVVEDVRRALEALRSAQSSLALVESGLIPTQERRRAEAEEAFRAGQVGLSTVLLAEEALSRAHESRLALAREVSAALHALQRAVGGPVRFRTLADPSLSQRIRPCTRLAPSPS